MIFGENSSTVIVLHITFIGVNISFHSKLVVLLQDSESLTFKRITS